MPMEKRLAQRLEKINPSPTLTITSKAKVLRAQGKDIINLAAGEPDFDTPDFIKEAAVEAIKNGFTKYTPTAGTPELKKLICEKFKKDNSLDYSPGQVVVSCGAKHSIFNALLVLVGQDEEVLIPSPYWVSYPEMVKLCEARPRFINTTQKNNFKITTKNLVKNINSKTKVLILNSPGNPTGAVYTLEELEEIAKVCVEKNIFVLSDEIYEKLIFNGQRHFSIAAINKDIHNLTVTINGLSKSYAMTGWRIGYLGAPFKIAELVTRLQDHSTSNPSSISQKAAEAALGAGDSFPKELCREFEKRRDYCVLRLKETQKIDYCLPQGAFYIFCDISKTALDSLSFANRLLEEAEVSLIPGQGFGWDTHVRISFAASKEELAKGLDRILEWLDKY